MNMSGEEGDWTSDFYGPPLFICQRQDCIKHGPLACFYYAAGAGELITDHSAVSKRRCGRVIKNYCQAVRYIDRKSVV